MATATIATVVKPRPIQPLPVVPISPAVIALTPDKITDASARALVDAKFDAALKEKIKQAIGSSNSAVGSFVDRLKLDYRTLAGLTIGQVIKQVVVPAMAKETGLVALSDLLKQDTDPPGAPTVAAILQPALPLASNPLFADDTRQGKTSEALRISGLDAALLPKLDAGKKQLEAWNDLDWDDAVAENILTPTQRDSLFFTAELGFQTADQLVGAGLTTSLRHISRFGPRPCGTP